MWNLKSKVNEQTKQKQTHRHRDRQTGAGGLGEKGEGVETYKLAVTKSAGDAKYSIGNRQ